MTEVTTLPVLRPQAMSVQQIEAEVTRLMASPAFRARAGSEGDAIALALRGRDLGLPPSTAISGLYTVNGRVSCETWLMMALVERDGLCESLEWQFEGDAPPDLAIIVATKRHGKRSHNTERLSWADITRAGLADKGVWPIYPKVMLRWQAIAQLYRVVYPDSVGGMYLPGELPDDTTPVVTTDGQLLRDVPALGSEEDAYRAGVQSGKTDAVIAQVRHALKEEQPEHLSDEQAVEIAGLGADLGITDEVITTGAVGIAGRELEHWTYLSPTEAEWVIDRMQAKLNPI